MWKHLVFQSAVVAASSLAMLTASSASAECPNETLRSELRSSALPDCRAYELATPVYKEGVNLTAEYAISQDGSHVIGGSTGAFAGAEDGQLGSSNVTGVAYEFSRAVSGWQAFSLAPPASQYNNNGMVDTSVDLSASLWELGARSQSLGLTDFYLERPRGTFTEVGPATPSSIADNAGHYIYLGASADLSHVFFSAEPGFRWPVDGTTGDTTIYEYVGTGNTAPLLVGVSGDRGSTKLESQCGTRLGSADTVSANRFGSFHGSAYNAISSSGQRVFFTAVACGEPPVDEVFAREEVSPTQSRTVAISEPAKEEGCEACQTGEGLMPAEFQGASEDGSKVFFTTAQELLAGAKGSNLYEYDLDAPQGSRVSRISIPVSGEAQVQGVTRISENGSHIYFVATGRLAGENAEHQQPFVGADNLYVFERDERFPEGRLSFVATLSPEDASDWRVEDERPVQVARDGRFLVFLSHADLTREGTSPGKAQVFQYDDQTGSLVRASIGQDGFDDNNREPTYGSTISNGAFSGYGYSAKDSPTMADGVLAPEDGAVFFESPDALTSQALNDEISDEGVLLPNIYEYRAGSVYLISDGRDTSTVNAAASVVLLGADATGGDVFFRTADSLIPEDTDTQQDFYDARVAGGFPSPAAAPGCSGDVCQGALGLTPVLPAPSGSATQSAEGGQAPVPAAGTAKPKRRPKTRQKTRKKKRPTKASQTARRHDQAGRRSGR
jgi:hypothetical protein